MRAVKGLTPPDLTTATKKV